MIQNASHAIKKFSHSTFSSLKIRNYRLYFVGQGISLCGTWMQTIGQAWLVLELTGSGTALGLVTALQFLPILILGPLGGVVADRFSKRKILFITQITAGFLAAILGVLVATHTVQLWMVYVLALALGLVGALDNPTRQTFIFEMAGSDEIGNAVTLNSMEVNLARIIGPAVAGVIIASIGLALCFFINAASYVAVLACLFLINSRHLHKREPVKRAKGQLREGFRYVRHTPLLFDVLMMFAIVGTLTYEFQISLAPSGKVYVPWQCERLCVAHVRHGPGGGDWRTRDRRTQENRPARTCGDCTGLGSYDYPCGDSTQFVAGGVCYGTCGDLLHTLYISW